MDLKAKDYFRETAKIVKINRVKKEMSQKNLAQAVGFRNGQFVSNIERGLCAVPLKKIVAMSKLLDIHPVDLGNAIVTDFSNKVAANIQKRS